MAELLLIHKDRAPTRYPLPQGVVTIGRSPSNRIHLSSPAVADRHAKIVVIGARCVIENMSRHAGTLVDRAEVDRHELQDAELIQIGQYHFQFRSRESAEVVPTAMVKALMEPRGDHEIRRPIAPVAAAAWARADNGNEDASGGDEPVIQDRLSNDHESEGPAADGGRWGDGAPEEDPAVTFGTIDTDPAAPDEDVNMAPAPAGALTPALDIPDFDPCLSPDEIPMNGLHVSTTDSARMPPSGKVENASEVVSAPALQSDAPRPSAVDTAGPASPVEVADDLLQDALSPLTLLAADLTDGGGTDEPDVVDAWTPDADRPGTDSEGLPEQSYGAGIDEPDVVDAWTPDADRPGTDSEGLPAQSYGAGTDEPDVVDASNSDPAGDGSATARVPKTYSVEHPSIPSPMEEDADPATLDTESKFADARPSPRNRFAGADPGSVVRAPALPAARLDILKGTNQGKRVNLEHPRSVLGLHGEHAVRLQWRNERHELSALSPRMTVRKNGNLVSTPTALLEDGDEIEFADVLLRYHRPHSSQSSSS